MGWPRWGWSGRAGARPARPSAEPGGALMVEALDPALHGGGVVAEELGDGAGRVALEGPQGHDQAQGEAEGTVEEGQELGVVVDGGRCEDVRWGQACGGLVVGLRAATRLLLSRRCTSPWRVAWPITRKTSGTPL